MKTGRWMMAAVAAAALSGCVAVPTGGGKKVYGDPTSTTQTLGTEGAMEIYPEAVRNGSTVTVRLMAEGTFVEETTETRPCTIQPVHKVAVGVLPGMASLKADAVPAGTLLALWHNICFLGMPTLNGLIVEPFNPNGVPKSSRAGDGHGFRRGALVGFHKYTLPAKAGPAKPKTTRKTVAEARPVEGIKARFLAPRRFWTGEKWWNGTLTLEGVQPGEKTGTLVIEQIPPGHLHEKDLKNWVGVEVDVTIPE